MEEMNADMDCLLRNNINAVRTCHYPDQIPWYYLCDEAGIYVMAETNLESHGTFQNLVRLNHPVVFLWIYSTVERSST